MLQQVQPDTVVLELSPSYVDRAKELQEFGNDDAYRLIKTKNHIMKGQSFLAWLTFLRFFESTKEEQKTPEIVNAYEYVNFPPKTNLY